jgi:AraC-like DNA-binding protein
MKFRTARKQPCALPPAGLDTLLEEVRCRAPYWLDQLTRITTHAEHQEYLRRLIEELRSLTRVLHSDAETFDEPPALADTIQRFMLGNLHRGPTLKDLAEFLGYSRKYCSDLFRAQMGAPFSQWLKRCRLDQAVKMLEESDDPITRIAERLGFSDQFAFSHFFKKAIGRSPLAFRNATKAAPVRSASNR